MSNVGPPKRDDVIMSVARLAASALEPRRIGDDVDTPAVAPISQPFRLREVSEHRPQTIKQTLSYS